jgi:hypothetical protein
MHFKWGDLPLFFVSFARFFLSFWGVSFFLSIARFGGFFWRTTVRSPQDKKKKKKETQTRVTKKNKKTKQKNKILVVVDPFFALIRLFTMTLF